MSYEKPHKKRGPGGPLFTAFKAKLQLSSHCPVTRSNNCTCRST